MRRYSKIFSIFILDPWEISGERIRSGKTDRTARARGYALAMVSIASGVAATA
jgi:hypothetical protein